jgi:hypothetical protein
MGEAGGQAEAGGEGGPRLTRAQAATLDVLVGQLLQERTASVGAISVAGVLARMRRANLAFPEEAVVQARVHAPLLPAL